jgi:hypothetical protein
MICSHHGAAFKLKAPKMQIPEHKIDLADIIRSLFRHQEHENRRFDDKGGGFIGRIGCRWVSIV